MLYRIDVIGVRGDICEHLTFDGKSTRCGVDIGQWQVAGKNDGNRNYACKRCSRIVRVFCPNVTLATPPWRG